MNILYSQHYYDDSSVKKLSITSLSEIAKNSTHISILSAYYSNEFFTDLFSTIPKRSRIKCIITLILNGFAGFRLQEQKEELRILDKELHILGYKNINIYLNIETSLFHTKLYCFKTENAVHWFIGSANASVSAFSQNEEILVHLTNENIPFQIYLEKVISNSINYRDLEDIKINSMVKFWRTGLIYYKPNANIQFTFSRLKIPDWVKKEFAQNQIHVKYSNPGEPLGPFNLKLALGFDDNEKLPKTHHNPLSIETCFGFWVPTIYKNKIDTQIDKAAYRKNKNLLDILRSMEEHGKEYITIRFSEYISGVNDNLNSIYSNYPWKVKDRIVVKYDDEYFIGTLTKVNKVTIVVKFDDGDNNTINKSDISIAGFGINRTRKRGIPEDKLTDWLVKEFWRPAENLNTQFEQFIDKLFIKLRDERHVKRASSPLVPSSMPEIWSDPVALDEFSESFYEYISYKINTTSKPLIIKSIQDKCVLKEEDGWETVKEKMEQSIAQNGWPDTNWKDK